MSTQLFVESHPKSCNISIEPKVSTETAYPKLSEAFRNLFTRDEVKDLVKRVVSPDAKLVDYHLRQYSEEKLGLLGSHLCLILIFRKSDHHKNATRSFFVKAVPFDVPAQAAYIQEKGCFRKETEFFKQLVPLMMENFKGENWAPKCYLTKELALVFEDLKISGFANRPKLFEEKSIESALACVARFHASSLLAEERAKGKPLNEIFPSLLDESDFRRDGQSYTWYSTAINLAVSLANELGLDSSQIKRASEQVFDACAPSKTKRNVVSHGDLHSSNMVFDNDGRCNLVDFQLVRYAPLAHDVMQILYLCAPKELRQKHERRMIQHYYQILIETLKMNDFKGELPRLEEVLQGAEEQRFGALVIAVVFHPSTLMDGKISAKIMNDPVNYEAYHFKDRKPFVDSVIACDPKYGEKLRENVRELVEMSLIFDSLPKPT